MADSFRCIVATPTRELFSGEVYYADVPGASGRYGVLRNHESLVAMNHQGGKLVLWLDPEGKETATFLIHRGCSQMLHNHLSVLGRFGCKPEDIDLSDVKSKAEELRASIDAKKAEIASSTEGADYIAADEAWVDTEEMHLTWYQYQIDYATNGSENH